MKFSTTNTTNLQTAIEMASKFTTSKGDKPALSGILLRAKGTTLTACGFNLETALETSAEVHVAVEGEALFSARIMAELVKRLPGDGTLITFEFSSKDLKVTFGKSEMTFPVMGNPKEHPGLPDLGAFENSMTMTGKLFKDVTRATAFACSNDTQRPWFTGVLWDIMPDKKVAFVSTDTHRLALYETEVTTSSFTEGRQVILHGNTMEDVSRLFKDNDTVELLFGETQVSVKSGNTTMVLRTISGTFPKYRSIFPTKFNTVVKVNAGDLLSSLERIEIVSKAKDGSNICKMNAEGFVLNLRSASPEVGKVSEEIAGAIEGNPIQISYNFRYIIDALKMLPGEEVELCLIAPLQGFIVRAPELPGYSYLLVPVRTLAEEAA